MSADIILTDRLADATDMATAKLIGDTLEGAYPGWLWHVEVSGGMANIKSMHANPRYGYRLHLARDFYSASDLRKQALMAGGELLERLNMPRRKADWDAINARPQKAGFLEYAR